MSCRHGRFTLAKSTRATPFGMVRRIICSPKKLNWDCPIALVSRPRQISSDLMAEEALPALAWKVVMRWLIGARFRSIQHSSPSINSALARFDMRKDQPHLQARKKRLAHHKGQTRMKSACF